MLYAMMYPTKHYQYHLCAMMYPTKHYQYHYQYQYHLCAMMYPAKHYHCISITCVQWFIQQSTTSTTCVQWMNDVPNKALVSISLVCKDVPNKAQSLESTAMMHTCPHTCSDVWCIQLTNYNVLQLSLNITLTVLHLQSLKTLWQ